MSDNRHYDNAPITEAMIDFRVEAASGVSVDDLKRIGESDPSLSKVEINQGTFQIKLGQGADEALVSKESSPVGYIYKSRDEKYVHQLRLDGFTSSRIAPYRDWEDLRASAKGMWEAYKSVIQPTKISRVAVRYINRIDLPLPVDDLDLYFRTMVSVSPELPQAISGYLMQLMLPLDDVGATAIINQAIIPPTIPDTAAVVLDIDVFCNAEITNDNEAWDTLEKLRVAKNKVFEASITDKVRELIS